MYTGVPVHNICANVKIKTILILLKKKKKRIVIYALHKSIAASIAAVKFVIYIPLLKLHGGFSMVYVYRKPIIIGYNYIATSCNGILIEFCVHTRFTIESI